LIILEQDMSGRRIEAGSKAAGIAAMKFHP